MRIYESERGIPFPFHGWKSGKELDKWATALGDFNDRCLAISLLQPSYINKCNPDEQHVLRNLQMYWLHEKEAQQLQLLHQVQKLNMEYAL
jgi:hypothetical protein